MFQFPALLSVTCSATPSTRKGNTCRAEPLQKRLTYREQIGPAGFSLLWGHGAQRLTSVPATPTPGCDCCASAFACGVKRRPSIEIAVWVFAASTGRASGNCQTAPNGGPYRAGTAMPRSRSGAACASSHLRNAGDLGTSDKVIQSNLRSPLRRLHEQLCLSNHGRNPGKRQQIQECRLSL